MGHSTKYHIKHKRSLQSEVYVEPEAQLKPREKQKASAAWRKIEEYQMLKKIRHDLEFYDEHLDGSLDDYLQ